MIILHNLVVLVYIDPETCNLSKTHLGKCKHKSIIFQVDYEIDNIVNKSCMFNLGLHQCVMLHVTLFLVLLVR